VKTLLKAQTWTVPSSSDGTTYFSASDGLTTGASGAGGLANSNAWFVVQIPGGTKQFCFQRGTTNQVWRVKYSFLAGFSGGTPGISRVPSATDERVLLGGGTDAAPTFSNLFGTADGGYRFSCAAQTTAPWAFFSFGFPTGGGNPTHGMFLDTIQSGTYNALDLDPYAVYIDGAGSASCLAANLFNGSSPMQCSFNNTTQTTVKMLQYAALNPVGDNGLSPNPYNGKDDLLPLFYAISTGTNTGIKGQSGTLAFDTVGTVTSHRTTPSPLKIVSSNDMIVIGSIVFPWDGSTPTV
jgi:hypothetical protein